MGKQRPDLPIFRRARQPGDCSSSGRLGSGGRTRMALLASPDVGIRRRALLSTVRSVRMRWQFSHAVTRVACIGVVVLSVFLAAYTFWSWRQVPQIPAETQAVPSWDNKLTTLDAHGVVGVRE